ncbi:hypothetical protein FNYG_03965 [Fusarium nygamai]|uniref:Uncharacterized protein n=1 Tax=Gibberella nygamai TaxID=42673 RepID=A0A2K0WKD7_GIBNY|nr:hypothetical protein FNYG_03965 [Fusarium nygamai]
MIPLRTIALSFLVMAPVAISAGACKPKSTDLTTAGSSSLQTASSSEALQSTTADLTTAIASTIETTSEAAATTSSTSCPSYTQVIPPPSGKVCAKEIGGGGFLTLSPLFLTTKLSATGFTGCAKHCADTPQAVFPSM